jgi:hypothetical protein
LYFMAYGSSGDDRSDPVIESLSGELAPVAAGSEI